MRFNILQKIRGSGSSPLRHRFAYIAWLNDIVKFPKADYRGVALMDDIEMKENTGMMQIYLTSPSQEYSYETIGDPDSKIFKVKFSGTHPGTEQEALEFAQNFLEEPFIVLIPSCESGVKVLGSPDAPLVFTSSHKSEKVGDKFIFNFEQEIGSEIVYQLYTGVITLNQNIEVDMGDFIEQLKQYMRLDGSNLTDQQKQNLKTILGIENKNIGNSDISLNENRNLNLKNYFLNFFSNTGFAKIGINKVNPSEALDVGGKVVTDAIILNDKVTTDKVGTIVRDGDNIYLKTTFGLEKIAKVTDYVNIDLGTILPDTLPPEAGWKIGWYSPQKSSNGYGIEYPNLIPAKDENGNPVILKAIEGYITKFYYDGEVWTEVKNKIPEPSNITPDRTTFFDSVNLANPLVRLVNRNVDETTGLYSDSPDYDVFQLIEVKESTSYSWNTVTRGAWYDKDLNFLSGFLDVTGIPSSYSSPSNARFISFAVLTGAQIMMNEGSPIDYVPYQAVIKSEYIGNIQPENIVDGSIAKEKLQNYKGSDSLSNMFLFGAGNWNSTGEHALAIGPEAFMSVESAGAIVAIGSRALKNHKSQNSNVAIGADAMMNSETCNDCSLIGHEAGLNMLGGVGDTGMGRRSLARAMWASNNTAFGDSTLFRNKAAQGSGLSAGNVAVGYVSMEYGFKNTATVGIGRAAGRFTNSTNNVLIGDAVLYGTELSSEDKEGTTVDVITTAENVTAVGAMAMNQAKNGCHENTVVGQLGLYQVEGIRNTAVGLQSGYNVTTGNGNTLIGWCADVTTGAVSNSIVIGYNVKTTKSNQIVIGNTDNDEFVFGGVVFTKAQLEALKLIIS